MKKFLTSLATFTALTAAASAADLPRRAAPPIFTPVPVFTWTGFYAGFNAGYGFDASDAGDPATFVATVDPRVVRPASLVGGPALGVFGFDNRGDQSGFTGGGQIGYNYQFTPGSGVVIGVEADAQYADFGRNRNGCASAFIDAATIRGPQAACNLAATATLPGLAPGVTVFNPTGLGGIDFYGTARGRIGYAFDRVLFYGTGGFAYASVGGGEAVDVDDFATGWTAGGGVEYALPTDSFLNFFRSSAVTLKVEGLYVNLDNGNSRFTFANANGVAIQATPLPNFVPGTTTSVIFNNLNKRDLEFAVVRAGINYKFGSY